jgi:hypothetical protein
MFWGQHWLSGGGPLPAGEHKPKQPTPKSGWRWTTVEGNTEVGYKITLHAGSGMQLKYDPFATIIWTETKSIAHAKMREVT